MDFPTKASGVSVRFVKMGCCQSEPKTEEFHLSFVRTQGTTESFNSATNTSSVLYIRPPKPQLTAYKNTQNNSQQTQSNNENFDQSSFGRFKCSKLGF